MAPNTISGSTVNGLGKPLISYHYIRGMRNTFPTQFQFQFRNGLLQKLLSHDNLKTPSYEKQC